MVLPFFRTFLLVIITFIVTPTIPGTLAFSCKDQEYGAGGTGVPGEPQKCLTVLVKSLQTPPPHLYP